MMAGAGDDSGGGGGLGNGRSSAAVAVTTGGARVGVVDRDLIVCWEQGVLRGDRAHLDRYLLAATILLAADEVRRAMNG